MDSTHLGKEQEIYTAAPTLPVTGSEDEVRRPFDELDVPILPVNHVANTRAPFRTVRCICVTFLVCGLILGAVLLACYKDGMPKMVKTLFGFNKFIGEQSVPRFICGVAVDNWTARKLSMNLSLQTLPLVAGVHPWSQPAFEGMHTGLFQCMDGSGEVPVAAVNDDYCDCKDGSDEPGTGACAGVGDHCFYCKNELATPKLVYASQVGDGICDCCDGSDEASLDPNPCPNRCEVEGAIIAASRRTRREDVRKGLERLNESLSLADAAIASWEHEKSQLEMTLPELERAAAELRKQRDQFQGKVDAEKKLAEAAAEAAAAEAAAKKAAEITPNKSEAIETEIAASATANPLFVIGELLMEEDFESENAGAQWSTAEGGSMKIVQDPSGTRGSVLQLLDCTWGGDSFSKASFACSMKEKCKISFWARGAPWQGFSLGTQRTQQELLDAHSWLAVPAAHAEGFHDRALTTDSTQDWAYYEYIFPLKDEFQMLGSPDVTFSTRKVHIMVQSHASTNHCSTTMFDDFKVWRVSSGVQSHSGDTRSDVAESSLPLEKPDVSEYAKWAIDRDEQPETPQSGIVPEGETHSIDPIQEERSLESEAEKLLKEANSNLTMANKASSDAKSRKAILEQHLKLDLGIGKRWFSLVDRCAEKELNGYKYKICFFKDATQDYTSLGRFEGWANDDPLMMIFTKGQHCHGGPARTLNVRFTCGSVEDITAIAEPSRCSYEAQVQHPAACSADDLLALEDGNQLSMPHDEL